MDAVADLEVDVLGGAFGVDALVGMELGGDGEIDRNFKNQGFALRSPVKRPACEWHMPRGTTYWLTPMYC
jgi:hypothetical protein